mgnify:CR=1 FL=1
MHRLPQVPSGDGCVHVEGHLRWATSVRKQPLVSAFHFGDRCGKCRLLFGSQRNAAAHAKAIEAPVPEPAFGDDYGSSAMMGP